MEPSSREEQLTLALLLKRAVSTSDDQEYLVALTRPLVRCGHHYWTFAVVPSSVCAGQDRLTQEESECALVSESHSNNV